MGDFDAGGAHGNAAHPGLDIRGEVSEGRYPLTTWTFGDDLAMVLLFHEVVVDYALRQKRELDADRLWINAWQRWPKQLPDVRQS